MENLELINSIDINSRQMYFLRTATQVALCENSQENEITLEHKIFCYQVLIVGLILFLILFGWKLYKKYRIEIRVDDVLDDLLLVVDGSEIVF